MRSQLPARPFLLPARLLPLLIWWCLHWLVSDYQCDDDLDEEEVEDVMMMIMMMMRRRRLWWFTCTSLLIARKTFAAAPHWLVSEEENDVMMMIAIIILMMMKLRMWWWWWGCVGDNLPSLDHDNDDDGEDEDLFLKPFANVSYIWSLFVITMKIKMISSIVFLLPSQWKLLQRADLLYSGDWSSVNSIWGLKWRQPGPLFV